MGKFKNAVHTNPIIEYLVSSGYEDDGGPCGEDGYVRIYHKGTNRAWVTIDLDGNKIYYYEEWDCGGCVNDWEQNIPKEWLSDLELFIDKIDEILTPWIG